MDKTKIKNFAIGAREKLIKDIVYKAGLLGITDDGIAEELPQSTADLKFFDIGTKEYAEVNGKEIKQRAALVQAIRDKEADCGKYKEAFDFVVEEVAYTWFNRLVAIRFMEVNDYLPSGVRVLSSKNKAKIEPDFVTTPFETDLDFTATEQDYIYELKDNNELDELFRILFIKQCNKLHDILPELFEKTDDYTELLLTISFRDKDGVVYRLIHDIDEEDFDIENLDNNGQINGQVEIIGWMYQYYISAKHDQIINIYKGTIKKDDIPAATQLFTTDWIVRYMVDNSLGRYWIERNPESNLVSKLEFFVKPKDGHINYVDEKIDPIELTFFDPCMGSGHILVYAFDVLMEIYRECGYTDRDAAKSIVENNLYGLDIDKRAYQLAYFAIMMKARSYDRRILNRGVLHNLTNIEESNAINRFTCDNLTNDETQNQIGEYLIKVYKHAREYGSLQSVEIKDYEHFKKYLDNLDNGAIDIFMVDWLSTVRPLMYRLVKQAKIMSKRYAVVCTNPPYMNKFEGNLKEFIQDNFKDYKGDLFSAFMVRNFRYCKKDGYSAFMTPFVWMFIKTYEQLRKYIITNKSVISLIQLEYSAFEEATVPICTFVLKNEIPNEKGLYIRLSDFKGGMKIQKEKTIQAILDPQCGYFYEIDQNEFNAITDVPFAYWASKTARAAYKNDNLDKIAQPRHGLATSDNNRFLKLWYEVNIEKTSTICRCDLSKKWFPMSKGGSFRKWYGNLEWIINYENNGQEIKEYATSIYKCSSRTIQNTKFYFKQGLTWSALTSGGFSVRWQEKGSLFGSGGYCAFAKSDIEMYILALLNSKATESFIGFISPTLNYEVGHIKTIPVVINHILHSKIDKVTMDNIKISKSDWDSFETSWDFIRNPLIQRQETLWDATAIGATMMHYYGKFIPTDSPLELCYLLCKGEFEERFQKLKSNEEELNRIFIDIYGLQDELTPEVEDKDVTVYRIFDTKEDIPESMGKSRYSLTKQDVVKDLISYAVGCMFGRYSLNMDGLAYAGGEWNENKYTTFIPDADNCIPITDEEYFEDDIVGRFVKFIEMVYGKDTLEENLNFIADALGGKGKTSREVIRNYFFNGFIKDHIKKYQKRPIYWLFDSGKQNGFKALVYMHRWNSDTVGNLRVEYLHKIQRVYEKEIERMQEIIDNSKNNKEISIANKRKEKLQKQLKETKDYDTKIAHIALSQIDIDLDDGVKVNYEKVQTAQDGKKMQILVKI